MGKYLLELFTDKPKILAYQINEKYIGYTIEIHGQGKPCKTQGH